jgi:hypothetical protein
MSRRVGVVVCLSTLGLLGVPLLAAVGTGVPVGVFLRDPVATLGGHPLTGLQSHVGVLIWWGAASICLFSVAVLRRPGERRLRAFAASYGVLSAVLALDDLFLLHEDLAPRYLGIHELAVVAAYGVAAVALTVAFRDVILRSEYRLLAAAVGFFAVSILTDQVIAKYWQSGWRIVVEDGLKLVGVVSWTAYFVGVCLRAVSGEQRAIEPPASEERAASRAGGGAVFAE